MKMALGVMLSVLVLMLILFVLVQLIEDIPFLIDALEKLNKKYGKEKKEDD